MFNEDLLVARKCDVTCWLYVAREGPTVGARVVVSGIKNKALVMLLILALSGDIELNPGPTQNNIAINSTEPSLHASINVSNLKNPTLHHAAKT